jgi:hypothetical protein
MGPVEASTMVDVPPLVLVLVTTEAILQLVVSDTLTCSPIPPGVWHATSEAIPRLERIFANAQVSTW